MAELIDFNRAKERRERIEAERAKKKDAHAAAMEHGARFRATLDQILKNALGSAGQAGSSANLQVVTTVEMLDSSDELQVRFALPGIDKDQLHLEFSDNLLRVNVSPKLIEGEKDKAGVALTQSIPLPHRVSSDEASATFDESQMLVVSFKKKVGLRDHFTPIEIQ